jgi:hypothetical protein
VLCCLSVNNFSNTTHKWPSRQPILSRPSSRLSVSAFTRPETIPDPMSSALTTSNHADRMPLSFSASYTPLQSQQRHTLLCQNPPATLRNRVIELAALLGYPPAPVLPKTPQPVAFLPSQTRLSPAIPDWLWGSYPVSRSEHRSPPVGPRGEN